VVALTIGHAQLATEAPAQLSGSGEAHLLEAFAGRLGGYANAKEGD